MKRSLAIGFAFAVALSFLGVGQPLYAQAKPQTLPTAREQTLHPANPLGPCCNITAINMATGAVTIKENATGRIITFQIAGFQPVDGAKLSQTFKVGSKIDFQPVDGAALRSSSRVHLTVAGFQPVDGIAASITMPGVTPAAVGQIQNKVAPLGPCCGITAINASTGVVTATVNATGKTFEFKPADAALLNSLKIGQGVYANFAASQVSVDGAAACCKIVSSGVASSAATAAGQQGSKTLAPSSSGTGLAHTGPGGQLTAALPPVTYGTPQRVRSGMLQGPPVKLSPMGSSVSSVNNNVVHLRGADAIKQASNLPEGARNLLLLHAYTLGPGEVDHYIVNTQLAADWIKAHPALANVKPPTSHDSHAGCGAISVHCAGEAGKHAEDQASQQYQQLLDAGRQEWQHVTHELAHDLQMVEGCFADQTLHLNDVPVDISPTDVPDLTLHLNKNDIPGLGVKAVNQYGSASADVAGTVTFGLPMDVHFKAQVDMFWIECLPFFIRPKSIQADGTFAVGTKFGAELIAKGQFTQELTVAALRFPISMIPIVIAGIPIAELDVSAYMDGKIYVDGNGRLDAKFSLETQRQTNAFDFSCSGHGCELNSHGLATKPETTTESVKLDGRVHVKPAVYVALQLDFDFDALSARAGPQPYLLGEVYACGAASGTQTAGGTSTSQESYALTADLDWGIDLRAEALVANKQVGNPRRITLLHPEHLAFWDLAHSTALLPQVQGVTQASLGQSTLYQIKMPACYPYSDKVKYQLAWSGGASGSSSTLGTSDSPPSTTVASKNLRQVAPSKVGGGNGSSATGAPACALQSGQGSCEFDPLKGLALNLAWPAAGTYTLTVTAIGDTPHGRAYNNPTGTVLNIIVGSGGATASGGSAGSGSTTSTPGSGAPTPPASAAPTAAVAPTPTIAGAIQNNVTPVGACCTITAIDASSGVVTAIVNAPRKTFQFQVADSALLNSLKVGRGVWANFRTKQVSLNGMNSCCVILSASPTQGGARSGQTSPSAPTAQSLSSVSPGTSPLALPPNPNHLPDLVPYVPGAALECEIPAGSTCQASCGSKKIPTNLGVHNLTQYPANGPIQIILKQITPNHIAKTWTVNGLGGDQWAFPGGFYTTWVCPTTETASSSNPTPPNYSLEVTDPTQQQLNTNNKIMQFYMPAGAVLCPARVDWSGCLQ